MKKIIFGIFAHPDDEAFGPSGALLKATRQGDELHLITFTNGDAGTNPDNIPDLGSARLEEWKRAGELMSAKTMHFLGYKDGSLSNTILLEATQKITEIVRSITESADEDHEVEFMTMDLNGITGHIDHIVAARTACLVFYRLKATNSRFRRIRLACWPKEAFPVINTDWIFMEPGRSKEEIDETIDARNLQDELKAIIETHHTQRHDGENFLAWQGSDLGLCYFLVKS
ncbi:MAG TPA: PIG-L family deacetylase [Candidatus Saccharimonadales bacterium]|nr:PIG-L family deacetylase [Candidatus Saccharimonadales bacterium]